MIKFVTVIGICLQIALQSCFAQDSIPKTSTVCDSCIVLSPEDVRKSNRIYDDRDECYAQFQEAVRVSAKWQQLYFDLKGKNRQLEKLKEQYRIDEASYEEFIELSVDELNTLDKKLQRLDKKVKRRNMWLYIAGGIIAAETVVIVAAFAVP